MLCRHCNQEIRLTSFKLPHELSVYLHTDTSVQTCYDIKHDRYNKAQPR